MTAVKRRYLDVLLGVFVALGIALLATFIFLIGQERRLFDTSSHIRVYFPNVAGLAVGAEVQLGGVVVGNVSEIQFPPVTTKDRNAAKRITVIMRISNAMMDWIRNDSVARIDSKGLLGDRTINISLGSVDSPQVKDGGVLESVPPVDLNQSFAQAQATLANVAETAEAAKKLLQGFAKAGGDVALAKAAKSLEHISDEVNKGQGIVHQLIYDKGAGADFKSAIASLSSATKSIDSAVGQAKDGKGLLHALLYDPKGDAVISQTNNLLSDLSAIFDEVRDGKGMIHGMIYDEMNGNLISNLNQASADLKEVMGGVKNGDGTLGRLLVDPSIYDELKQVLSEVRRNTVLKALVRFALSKGDAPTIHVKVPEKAPEVPVQP